MGYVLVPESKSTLLLEKSVAELPEFAVVDLLIKRISHRKFPVALTATGEDDEGLFKALTLGSPFREGAEVLAAQPDAKLSVAPEIKYKLSIGRKEASVSVGQLTPAEQDEMLTRSLDRKTWQSKTDALVKARSNGVSKPTGYGLVPITMTFYGAPQPLDSRMRVQRAVWEGYHAYIKRRVDEQNARLRDLVVRALGLPDKSEFGAKDLDETARQNLEDALRGRPDLWKELGASSLEDAMANCRLSVSDVDLMVAFGMYLDNSQPMPRSKSFSRYSIRALGSPP